jgi:pimeloyl-ACP methyl ester carboxylesterase
MALRTRVTRRNGIDDLRGASQLAIAAVKGVTDLVEAMHQTIGGGPAVLGRPFALPTRVVSAPVYASIRAVTDLVGAGIELPLGQLARLLSEDAGPLPGAKESDREAIRAALNGVLGDYLAETNNPLATLMCARHEGEVLSYEKEALRSAIPEAGRKVVVLVHGSSMNAAQWRRRGHDHGASLGRALGRTPIYIDYNSGLHVSVNGRALAEQLEQLVRAWPVPLEELVLVGFSMGGLLLRSACHYGEGAAHAWRRAVTKLVCLGTPHHGAPLERGGRWIDALLRVSRYSAPLVVLGRIRSAGVTDMRFGNVLDEDWQGHHRFEQGDDHRTPLPLPADVDCYAIAATTATDASARLPSDGLVPVDSALGVSKRPGFTLAFAPPHRFIAYGARHLDLLDRADVYAALEGWLA